VGSTLCYHMPAWQPGEGDDVRELLLPLAADLRLRLESEGIDRTMATDPGASTVPSRSREDARALAGMLPFVSLLVEGEEHQLALIDEGIDWARIAADLRQETILRTLRAAMQHPSRHL